MKIVLINPPTTFSNIYGEWDLSGVDTYIPPLGLLYLAGYIRQFHHNVYIIDLPALKWSLSRAVRSILSLRPDVVGLSAMTINISNANSLAQALKKEDANLPIIVGGAHMTAVPEETLRRFSAIDYGVAGEGEISFLELLNGVDGYGSLKEIKGLVWRDLSGRIVVNPRRPLIPDLDVLPLPAWDLLPNFPEAYPHNALETKRLPAASIMTTRGCPNQCTFCDRSVFGSTIRHHSADYSINMIRHLRNTYNIKDLMILDDNFLVDKKKLFKICDAIVEEKMGLKWYCLSHVNFMSDVRLRKIRDAGCWIMEVGIESGSERILHLLKRNTTKNRIAEAIKKARDLGLKVKGNFIFGLPTETLETLEETIEFALSLDISLFEQNFLTIFPGCELSLNADLYGYREKDWEKQSTLQISFIPFGLSREDLVRASKNAFRRFYLRPKIILGILLSINSLRTLKSMLAGLRAFLKGFLRKK